MARTSKTPPLDSATLLAAAKARGITIPPTQAKAALAGARWLRDCVALLDKAGFR